MMNNFLRLFLITGILFLYTGMSECQEDTSVEGNYEIDDINIKFIESSTFDESTIKGLLASKSGDYFDMTTFLLDVERIKKYYFDNGFFDAEVDTGLFTNIEDKEINETFTVKENARYEYLNINYTGIDSISADLTGKIQNQKNSFTKKGRYYSKDSVNLERGRIMDLLQDNGYATASALNPEIFKYVTNIDSLFYKVNIKFVLDPGKKYEFGKTVVKFTNDKYNITEDDIRRELEYKENDTYDKSKIVKSEINLTRFSILENPRIVIDTINENSNKIDFIVNAVVGNKYDVTPEVFGYYFQNSFYMGTGVSFNDLNFFGDGRVLTSRARFYYNSPKNNRLEFVNTISQPFLFGNRFITGNWNIGYEYRLQDDIIQSIFKNSFNVVYELPDYTYVNNLQFRWELENSRFVLNNDIVSEEEEILLPNFDLNEFISKFGFTIIHSSVNNIVFPSAGNYQSYEIEESGLLSGVIRKIFNTASYSYSKFTNLSSAYINLSNREVNVTAVLAFKLLAGIIAEYGQNSFTFLGQEFSSDRVPRDTRYFGGGSTSVRGWAARQLGIVPDKDLGGNFTYENTVEYRVKPFLSMSNEYLRDLGFVGFVDYGNVWSDIGKFKLNEIAIAAGTGIRYYTIIGAIRFDVGFKIYDPQPGPIGGSNWIFAPGSNFNDKYNFQFGIGNTF